MSTSIDEARTDGGYPELFNPALAYRVDATQRQVLFWATPRQRGEKYRARSSKAAPPVLDFAIELVIDRGTPKWPVNYVLVRVVSRKAPRSTGHAVPIDGGYHVID